MRISEILDEKKGVIFDIEGVFVKSIETPYIYDDAVKLLKYVHEKGKKIVFLTNLARVSATRVARKLNLLIGDLIDFELKRESIINPTISAVEGYIEEKYKKPVKVFLISEGGHYEDLIFYDWIEVTNTISADLVLLGADRTLTYQKLNTAFRLLRKGKEIIVLGGDLYSGGEIFGEKGEFIMEGAIAKALEVATGIKGIISGKPSALAFKTALKKLNLKPRDVLMIGDSIKNDVIGAISFEIDTLHINREKNSISLPNEVIEKSKANIYTTTCLKPNIICEKIEKL